MEYSYGPVLRRQTLIIQKFHYEDLWNIVNSSWFICNDDLHCDLKMNTIKEICREA